MSYTRRKFIKTAGLGTAGFTLPVSFSSCNLKMKKPNILFIMSDDHAEQAISCYSKKLIHTPSIDRIAQEGILFKNSFVTNSICAPSRATMLTGKYSHENGLRDNSDEFDGSQVTFPKLLQKAGYNTYILGKWHLKSKPTGFNRWQVLIDQGEYYNPVFLEKGGGRQYTGYTTDLITDKALEILEQRDRKKPFCLLVHHKAPHRNWMPDPEHMKAFDNTDLPIPETFYDDYANRPAAANADMRIEDMYLSYDLKLKKGFYKKETGTGGNTKFAVNVKKTWQKTYERLTEEQRKAWDAHYDVMNKKFKKASLSGKDLLEWKYQRYIKDYLRCILSLDENIGRLLEYLDRTGLVEDTIVIYTSDQGFYLGEHGWYDKRFMYEESLSMPLIMRYPLEIKENQVSEDMVLNLDFAPTLLDFAGVEIPGEMQGESFRSLTHGKTPGDWRSSMYYHYYEYPHGWHNVMPHYGIRTQRYKLIHFYQGVDKWELYDLDKDPHEINNVYDDPAFFTIVNELKTELKKLQQKYGERDVTR
jgi:arylsulfatase A-like enzyme